MIGVSRVHAPPPAGCVQQLLLGLLLKVFASEPVQTRLHQWKVEILAAIRTELTTWLPVIVKTVVAGIAQAAGQLTVNTADKVTDIIPGRVDDDIIDPIVSDALSKLTELTGIAFR